MTSFLAPLRTDCRLERGTIPATGFPAQQSGPGSTGRAVKWLLFLVLFSWQLPAQMPVDGTLRYGDEWITDDQEYRRIDVAEDGVYLIPEAALEGETNVKIWHRGREVAQRRTERGILFYGRKNRGEQDRFLYAEPGKMQLNDRYSLHTDTAAYFLELGGSGSLMSEGGLDGGARPAGARVLKRAVRVYDQGWSKNFFRSASSSIYQSYYDVAEGFGQLGSRDLLRSDGSTEMATEVELPDATGEPGQLTYRFGLGFDAHRQEVRIDGREVETIETGTGFSVQQRTTAFTPRGESVELRLTGRAGDRDKANLAWVEATYPASARLAPGESFLLLSGGALELTVTLSESVDAPENLVLYNLTDERFYRAAANGQDVNFPLDARSDTTEYLLANPEEYRIASPALTVRAPQLLPPAGTDYLIVTSQRLNGPEVTAYAAYRASPAGGSYRVHVVTAEDLETRYGYGIRRHPQALRNYLAATRAAGIELRFLYLIGKGREYPDMRTPEEYDRARATYFVPSFGFPASDNLLTAPLGGVVPSIATGRLSAVTPTEIGVYLRKLRAVERQTAERAQTLEGREWMKKFLHLGGGGTANEQANIRANLERMAATIRQTELGGDVEAFYKTSTDRLEDSRVAGIFDRINDGTAMITFYGHSSNQRFDFSIDDPDNYRNFGRTPFMLSLGCYSGDAFGEARSISERFLFLPERAAVAFAASKGVGFIGALGDFGNNYYRVLGNEMYGRGIGEALNENIRQLSGNRSWLIQILLQQFSLSGDPAFRLHPQPGPDLVPDPTSVRFEPSVVPAQDADFGVSVRVVNIGKGTPTAGDSVTVRFSQQLPGGAVRELTDRRIAVPNFDTLLQTRLPNLGFEAVGQNRILIEVDAGRELAEEPGGAEANNTLRSGDRPGVPITVVANTARVAAPAEFATVPPGTTLVAATTDPAAPERTYRYELARDAAFRNTIERREITTAGGLIRIEPTGATADSTTYYWRISPDSSATEGSGLIWSTSSFTVIENLAPDERGWAQREGGQFERGTFKNVGLVAGGPRWRFRRTTNDVNLIIKVFAPSDPPRWEYNGQITGSRHPWDVRAGIQVTVLDSTDNRARQEHAPNEWNTASGRTDLYSFDTRTAPGRAGLIDFLQNGIERGKYVILHSAQRGDDIEYYNAGWLEDSLTAGASVFSVLEAQGAQQIRRLTERGSVPYALAYQQGMGLLAEDMAADPSGAATALATLTEILTEGEWSSAAVGPTNDWRSLELSFRPEAIAPADAATLSLFGGTEPASLTSVLQTETLDLNQQLDYRFDLADVDPKAYPYLGIRLELSDPADRSSPSLRHAFFDFEPPGDVAINPAVALEVPDSIAPGQAATLRVGYENLSVTPFDSLLVELELTDPANRTTTLRQRQAPLPAVATDIVTFDLPAELLAGDQRLQLTLNPGREQAERVVFNNVLSPRLKVGRDATAPEAFVYFDGRRIRDGDLVSGQPEILVQLRDESRFLKLDDTASITLTLALPDGTTERLSPTDARLDFRPATSEDNLAELYFRPELLQDGRYTLAIEARDRSGNLAGGDLLQKSFEVINEQRVGNVLTYPNPFSTQTRFVYTLTGNAPPAIFRIQIMTVSGRVVRDIDLLATETLRVGTHQTDFAWDGTDEYGDPLANGVYLYRVLTRDDNGQQLEAHDTGTDRFFLNNLGKVVILR